ncbi:hypothetical protein VTH82DRAFT_5355 [Thermothelomyces myriococcoides]
MKLRVRLYVIGILNLGYLAVLMGILKAVYMLTAGGILNVIFDYWLSIGIIAACASLPQAAGRAHAQAQQLCRALVPNGHAVRGASGAPQSASTPSAAGTQTVVAGGDVAVDESRPGCRCASHIRCPK